MMVTQVVGGSCLTCLVDNLLYSWRDDSHCCVDLVSVLPTRGGWTDVTFALASVEQGKL